MTPDEIDLVKTSWRQIVDSAHPVGQLFYQKLFLLDPSLRALFLADLDSQQSKFHATLSTIIENLDQPALLTDRVHTLGVSHAGYGVRDEHYATVEEALLWALRECLRGGFSDNIAIAWQKAYRAVAEAMVSADLDSGCHPL